MGANGSILSRITSLDQTAPSRVTKQEPPIMPTREEPARLIASPFQIDQRGEYIAEQRRDADILDQEAEELTRQAVAKNQRATCLRIAADHMEQNPPE